MMCMGSPGLSDRHKAAATREFDQTLTMLADDSIPEHSSRVH